MFKVKRVHKGLGYTGLWLARNEGMEKNIMETAIMGYIGTTIKIFA